MKNLPDSSVVSLFQLENRQYAAVMLSDTVTDGRFVLRDTITSKESRLPALHGGTAGNGRSESYV